jgi:hypothetical protein
MLPSSLIIRVFNSTMSAWCTFATAHLHAISSFPSAVIRDIVTNGQHQPDIFEFENPFLFPVTYIPIRRRSQLFDGTLTTQPLVCVCLFRVELCGELC